MNQLRRLFMPKNAITLLGVSLLIAGIWLFVSSGSSQPTIKKNAAAGSHRVGTAIVEITAGGFTPSTVSVNAGTEITWVNEDSQPHLPAADPYPTHAELPRLVAPRSLGNKETYTFLFTKATTIHYHDDLNPMLTGTIEVR